MSDMKCPFCGQKLESHNYTSGRFRHTVVCVNKDCKLDGVVLPKIIWQELIRTRKALDILSFTINRLENQNYKDCAWHLRLAIAKIEAMGIANKALDEITALEQKE